MVKSKPLNPKQLHELKQQIVVLAQSKQYPRAETLALQLIQSAPKDLEARLVLAQLLQAQGKVQAALQHYLMAGKGKSPVSIAALSSAMQLAEKTHNYAEAFVASRELVKRQPKDLLLHEKLAFFARIVKHDYLAQTHYKKAMALGKPSYKLMFDCAETSNHLGETDFALDCYDRAARLDSSVDEPHYQAAFASNYSDKLSENEVFKRHQDFGKRLEGRYPSQSNQELTKGKRIRIAYVCQDFRRHSVAYFLLPILEHYSKNRFEVFSYSDVVQPDDITEKMKGLSEHWRDTHEMSHEELYQTITNDKVDILVDLIGYTGRSRAEVFAQRAAPIQVSYLAYPNTSGLSRMDYRLTDEWADPTGQTESFHTEQLVRLPSGFLNFQQIDHNAPEVSKLPALENKFVTFGSFNVFPKLSPTIIQCWINILKAVPKSKLLVKAKLFFEEDMKKQFAAQFVRSGIKKERLILIGLEPSISDHLKRYSQIDIHLDSFPYHGTTTTCEALWQGIPTISLAGENHRARVGCSILSQVGLKQFIAHSTEEYVEKAIQHAGDLEILAELRSTLRGKVQNSPLMDRQNFISELESAYDSMIDDHRLG